MAERRAGRKRGRAALAAVAVVLVALAAGGGRVAAQQLAVGDPLEEYLRVLQLVGRADIGSFTVRPLRLSDARAALGSGTHPWTLQFAAPSGADPKRARVEPRDANLRVFANTSLPVGQNDGAIWQGKGLTTALDVGATAVWRALSVTAHPMLVHTQNASFELAPVTLTNLPEYAYPWRRIDMPQRFGPDAFWTLDPGQTEVRVRAYGATAAFGTTSLWWGPAQRNAIVMSNHAGGFPHASLGTDGPVDIGIGVLEVQWIWGDLAQSEWFDPALDDIHRFLTGIVIAYAPSFIDGLTLGGTRVFYSWKPADGISVGDYFMVFQGVRKEALATPENPTGGDEHDQLLSLFARWVFPASGFEFYAEWARNDHSWNFRDFIQQPAHSRAYTLGLQKAFALSGERLLAVRAELTDLQKGNHPRAAPTYYAHHIVTQGYTHRGQVIGAAVGPGGNAQHLGAELYSARGRVGVFLQREIRDNDAYLVWAQSNPTPLYEHDVLLHGGAQALVFLDALEIGGGLLLTRELNRYFVGRDLWNLNVSLSARWRPR